MKNCFKYHLSQRIVQIVAVLSEQEANSFLEPHSLLEAATIFDFLIDSTKFVLPLRDVVPFVGGNFPGVFTTYIGFVDFLARGRIISFQQWWLTEIFHAEHNVFLNFFNISIYEIFEAEAMTEGPHVTCFYGGIKSKMERTIISMLTRRSFWPSCSASSVT